MGPQPPPSRPFPPLARTAHTTPGRAAGNANAPARSDVRGHRGESGGAPTGFDEASALAAMARLEEEVETLRRREREREAALNRLEVELRAASAMQRQWMDTATPSVRGARLTAIYRPVSELCGDAYEVRRLDDHRIAICLSDATGHGLSAALLSASTRMLMRPDTVSGTDGSLISPDEVLRRANTELHDRALPDCQFLAAIVAIYDETTRILTWARGGAPYPVLVRRGSRVSLLRTDGPLLGATEAARFELARAELQPGDRVVFHTDGVEKLVAEMGSDAIFGASDGLDLAVDAWRDQLESLLSLRAYLIDDDVTILALDITGD